MTTEEAKQLTPGTKVRETEFNLEGTFEELGKSGLEVQVSHNYDGGGFDFWPIETLERV
jgi:hypothetical protein